MTQQVNLRNQRVAQEGNQMISMDPRIAAIFNQSTAISGKSPSLISNLLFSLQGQVLAPDEALSRLAQVQSADRAGEARGQVEGS